MPPVHFCFTEENRFNVGAKQSARITFLDKNGNEICFVGIKGTENGGEITVRENKDGQINEDHFTVEAGQMNKEHLCKKTPIVVIGTSN